MKQSYVTRRVNELMIFVELPENPEDPLKGSDHVVTVRPVSMAGCVSPATFSSFVTVSELEENNQSWVLFATWIIK